MREHINLIEASTKPATLETAPLPYALDELDPVFSSAALDFHYENLAKGYAKKYNAGIGNADFNRAGNYLHDKFFSQFKKPKRSNLPKGASAELIKTKFKTFEDFQIAIVDAALELQGSGWVYLSTSGEIKTIKNHAVRTDIVLIIDMWEHAYALDYKWDKEKYLSNIWRIVNWDIINERIV